MKRWMVLLMMVVFAVGVYAQEKAPTKEKTRLEYKWEKGKTCKYKMTQEMKQKMSGTPQGDMETSMNRVVVYSEKVTKVDEKGVATIECKYESIKMDIDHPMVGKITLDSTKEEDMKNAKDNPQLAGSAVMVGKTLTVKITYDGEVLEVKGGGKLIEEISGEIEDDTIIEELKKAFSDESMKKMMQRSYARLSKKEVGIGDSWETSVEMPMGFMTVKAKGKNIYAGNETIGKRECAKIDTQMDMTISMDPDNPFSQMFDMEWEPTSGTAFYCFDPKDGIMVKQEAKINTKGTLTTKQGEEKVEVKMEQEMIIKMELVE